MDRPELALQFLAIFRPEVRFKIFGEAL